MTFFRPRWPIRHRASCRVRVSSRQGCCRLALGTKRLPDGRSGDGGNEPRTDALEQRRVDASRIGWLLRPEADHERMRRKGHDEQEHDDQDHAVGRQSRPQYRHHDAGESARKRGCDRCGNECHVAPKVGPENIESKGHVRTGSGSEKRDVAAGEA